MANWLSDNELNEMHFASLGKNVLISKTAIIRNPTNIYLGNNIRIDDFCQISAPEHPIKCIGYNHIAAYTQIVGNGGLYLGFCSGISSRVSIFSSNDDYTGEYLTGPLVPIDTRKVDSRRVHIFNHCIVGSGSVILPGSTLSHGTAIGALSLVNGIQTEEWAVYAGSPIKWRSLRSKELLRYVPKLDI